MAAFKARILGTVAVLALLIAPSVWASGGSGSGGGGGDDDDSQEESSDDSGGDDGGESSGGDDGDDSPDEGGESSGDDDGESSGGEGGGDDGGESSGSGGEGGESGGGESGGEGGESGRNDDRSGSRNSGSGSDSSHGSGRAHDVEDGIKVSRNDDGEPVREGEALLLTRDESVPERLKKDGLEVIEVSRLGSIGSTAVRVALPDGMRDRELLEKLRAIDPKGVATFNHVYEPASAGVGVPTALQSTQPRVAALPAKVGLVDAAVNIKHPLLKSVNVTARAFDQRAGAIDSHGTAVASRIAEAAPGAKVFAANVFTVASDGQEIATADAIARGLDWLAQLRIPVINLSLTGPANPMLEHMSAQLASQGFILVAAVGNEGPRGAPQYPAAYEHVVGVTAVDVDNRVYRYANQGSYVDFAARGVDARVANGAGEVDTVSGTSYASPIIAAKLSRYVDRPDRAQADAAIKALAAEARDLGAPGRDPVYGYGLITNR